MQARWRADIQTDGDGALSVDGRKIGFSADPRPDDVPWGDLGFDIVLECTGKFRTVESLQPYFDRGVKRVIVAAPVKEDSVLNVVMGVNDHMYDPDVHTIVTATSCTTNCLAPVVKVVHEAIGIRHGQITTIHDRPTPTLWLTPRTRTFAGRARRSCHCSRQQPEVQLP